MEHSFRIAIWMFLLLGFLQAKPISERSFYILEELKSNVGLKFLRKEVSCSENVTFASPSDMTGDCPRYSLTVMKDGLGRAKKECEGIGRVGQALDALDALSKYINDQNETSSNCTSQEAGNWMQFLDGSKTLFQRLRSKQ